VPIPLQWEGDIVPRHREILHTAQARQNFVTQAWQRIYPATTGVPHRVVVAPLAVGGAMAVYKLTVWLAAQVCGHIVCKIPHDRRLVYAAGTATEDTHDSTYHLLHRLAALADHLTHQAPGLFPRCGGLWYWQNSGASPCYLLVEEFIPGVSVERLKHGYEQQLMAGALSPAAYQQRRIAAERLAVAAFIRLWVALGRHTFTHDY
jgi:hypothetical protein